MVVRLSTSLVVAVLVVTLAGGCRTALGAGYQAASAAFGAGAVVLERHDPHGYPVSIGVDHPRGIRGAYLHPHGSHEGGIHKSKLHDEAGGALTAGGKSGE